MIVFKHLKGREVAHNLLEIGGTGSSVTTVLFFHASCELDLRKNDMPTSERILGNQLVPGEQIRPASLVEWIETCISTFPETTCVTASGETLTFAELWRRATALASALQDLGVKKGESVGLLVEQSADQLVGMVAILTAGAVYVPLDPSYPLSRLSQMVLDSKMAFVVTPEHLRPKAESLEVRPVATTGWSAANSSTARAKIGLDDVAYIIFTSGSTGLPKGVVIEHGALIALLEWMIDDCGVRAGDRIMGTASANFDASMPNFLLPLVTGATFVALAPDALRDPRELAAAVEKMRPRFLETSPTMLRMLTEMRWQGDPDIEIWTGSERSAPSVISYLVPRVRSFCNYYGPTEATVQVTVARLSREDVDSPIGWPPLQFGCHVLDEEGQHVGPLGQGELFITGPTLARGYLNDPVLTSARFVEIPDAQGMPVRAFRTGDIVRYRDDGALVVVGRADAQIKLRGYRIEPGEVETQLMAIAGVTDAAVVGARHDDDDEAQLVAFVVGRDSLDTKSLDRELGQRLPEYMIPRHIQFVDAFPIAPSGKVDRQALVEMATTSLRAPVLAEVNKPLVVGDEFDNFIHHSFASTLHLPEDSFGIDADFFELGGTSLRCARLFMLLEDQFDVALPLSTMLATPTVRRLAEVVRREKGVGVKEKAMSSFKWEQIIGTLWSDLLEVQGVGPTDSFYQLGGDDALAQRFIDLFNGQNGKHVTMAAFREGPTIVQLGALVSGDAPRDSLVVLNAQGRQVPFFCIAGAGGLALAFLPLTKALGPDQPFFGLQAHGLESRAVPNFTLGSAARSYARIIQDVQPHGPYVIAGHSLGGVIALRVVQLLEKASHKVALLVIFDSVLSPRMVGSPPSGSREPMGAGDMTVKGIVKMRPNLANVLRLPLLGVVRQRGVAQFESFNKLGVVQAMLARRLRPWSGRAVVYVSNMNPEVIESRWRQLLTGSWIAVKFSTDHLSILRFPIVVELAADLRTRIAEALTEHGEQTR